VLSDKGADRLPVGKRTNPIMGGMAAPLSNQDIEDLASWYSGSKA
jgi:cytochrome c553